VRVDSFGSPVCLEVYMLDEEVYDHKHWFLYTFQDSGGIGIGEADAKVIIFFVTIKLGRSLN
jgi:hypothetical protein